MQRRPFKQAWRTNPKTSYVTRKLFGCRLLTCYVGNACLAGEYRREHSRAYTGKGGWREEREDKRRGDCSLIVYAPRIVFGHTRSLVNTNLFFRLHCTHSPAIIRIPFFRIIIDPAVYVFLGSNLSSYHSFFLRTYDALVNITTANLSQ